MPTRGYSSTPSKRRPRAKLKPRSTEERRAQSAQRAKGQTRAKPQQLDQVVRRSRPSTISRKPPVALKPRSTEERRAQSAQRAQGQTRVKPRDAGTIGELKGISRPRLRSRAVQIAISTRTKPREVERGLRLAPGYKPGAKLKRRATTTGSLSALPKVARVLAHSVEAIGENVYKRPVESVEKSAKFVGEVAKGAAAATLGLAHYGVKTSLVGRAAGMKVKDEDQPLRVAGRIAKGAVDRVSKVYGPSYRGEKGAKKHLKRVVRKEGPLPVALDIATAAVPVSSGAGATLRLGKRPRAKLKVAPLKPGQKQKQRPSAIGFTAAKSHDAARKAAQKVAVARSRKRLRVRAVKRVTGKDIERRVPGRKPRVTNTEPRHLSARRATLKPGEVAPLVGRFADMKVRRSVARDKSRGERTANYRTSRHIADPKSRESLVRAFRPVPRELHHAALKAAQLGIRDSKGARTIIERRIAEIERNRAAAGRKGADPKRAAVEAKAKGDEGELATLREYLRNPAIFDRADVQAAADNVRGLRGVVGARQGLTAERAARGRAELLGGTLGVRTAKQHADEAKAAQKQINAGARRAVVDLRAERAASRERGQKRIAAAQAELAKAVGRAEVLSRNVTGRNTGLKQNGRYVAGQVGVERAERALAAARSALNDELATVNAKATQAAKLRRVTDKPPKLPRESWQAYEKRVEAAARERGLAAPAYVPSRLERDPSPTTGGQPSHIRSNPLARERKGTLYALGREGTTPADVGRTVAATIRRGADIEAEARILQKHGVRFRSRDEAVEHARRLGLNTDDAAGTLDYMLHIPGVAHKSTGATPRPRRKSGRPDPKSDLGDFVKTDDVWLMSRAAGEELRALNKQASSPPSALMRLAHAPQAALLALSPAWFQFQRVNDLVALTLSGAAPHARSLIQMRKQLTPDEREVLAVMAGDSIGSTVLKPTSMRDLGRMQRILESNPLFARAFSGQNPGTALLRLDQRITGNARELQLLHELRRVARGLDPEVSTVRRAFAPIGHAYKTGDIELVRKLLTDPKHNARLEEGVERLIKIAGDWHTYTSTEARLRAGAAFYGFLRYATRLALYTLPVQHPYIGMLIAQIGAAGAADAKRIIGPDIPYGLGALYRKDGTVAADLSKGNPLLGPLLTTNKPEQIIGTATPLVGVTLNYLLGQQVYYNESAEGRIKKLTVGGDPSEHNIGGLTSKARTRFGADQLLSLLAPYRWWKGFDPRAQSSDSLPWDRKILRYTADTASSAEAEVRLRERNRANAARGGWGGVLRQVAPLLTPGAGENVKAKGESIRKAKRHTEHQRRLRLARRRAALGGPGEVKRELAILKAEMQAAVDETQEPVEDIKRELELLKAEMGLGGR